MCFFVVCHRRSAMISDQVRCMYMDHGMADRFRFVASGVLSGRGSQICCYVRLKSDFVSPVVKEDSQRISETCRHVPPFHLCFSPLPAKRTVLGLLRHRMPLCASVPTSIRPSASVQILEINRRNTFYSGGRGRWPMSICSEKKYY